MKAPTHVNTLVWRRGFWSKYNGNRGITPVEVWDRTRFEPTSALRERSCRFSLCVGTHFQLEFLRAKESLCWLPSHPVLGPGQRGKDIWLNQLRHMLVAINKCHPRSSSMDPAGAFKLWHGTACQSIAILAWETTDNLKCISWIQRPKSEHIIQYIGLIQLWCLTNTYIYLYRYIFIFTCMHTYIQYL